MPQYVGFSSINACQPRSTNKQLNDSMNTLGNYGTPTGYGTIGKSSNSGKKFTVADVQLVVQDFINALNIPLGSKVGQPGYGTSIWNFIFEPNTVDVQNRLEAEIRRLVALDPRLDINTIKAFPQENGILLEVQVSVVPFNNPLTLNVFFNQQTTKATIST